MTLDLEELVKKLCSFKKQLFSKGVHASDCGREGYKKIEIWNWDWKYVAHFKEFPFLPENEELSYNLEPVWKISYTGGMVASHSENANFVLQVNDFLKRALCTIEPVRAFRGPKRFASGVYVYTNPNHFDLRNAKGNRESIGSERVLYNGKKVWLMDHVWEIIIG